jgi:hypothetical protein
MTGVLKRQICIGRIGAEGDRKRNHNLIVDLLNYLSLCSLKCYRGADKYSLEDLFTCQMIHSLFAFCDKTNNISAKVCMNSITCVASSIVGKPGANL